MTRIPVTAADVAQLNETGSGAKSLWFLLGITAEIGHNALGLLWVRKAQQQLRSIEQRIEAAEVKKAERKDRDAAGQTNAAFSVVNGTPFGTVSTATTLRLPSPRYCAHDACGPAPSDPNGDAA